MPTGVIARLVGGVLFVSLVMGGALYFTHLGKKLEKQELLLRNQARDLELRQENERRLAEAMEEQTAAVEESRQAARTAEELYNQVVNQPRPVRVVPRDRVVEVIRPGNCDNAALDAWDLLQEKGITKWESDARYDSDYWRDYYLDYARHVQPPQPVQLDIHVSRPLTPGLTAWRSPHPGLSSPLYPGWNSGLPISVEIRSPQTGQFSYKR